MQGVRAGADRGAHESSPGFDRQPSVMLIPDPWSHLRPLTPARIALGRAGGSLPTAQWLDFAKDHALARDAVQAVLDTPDLLSQLAPLLSPADHLAGSTFTGKPPQSPAAWLTLATRATNRRDYLLRPDWGRQLAGASAEQLDALAARAPETFDLAVVVSDGLSAFAAQRQVAPLLAHLLPLLRETGWRLAPLIVIPLARVAVQDEVGERLRAKAALILLGERPGLLSPDSLGAYLVWGPRRGRTDADRNCVSNIRPEGLPHPLAARTLARLLNAARRLEFSGVHLKDEGDPTLGTTLPTTLTEGRPTGSRHPARLPLLASLPEDFSRGTGGASTVPPGPSQPGPSQPGQTQPPDSPAGPTGTDPSGGRTGR